MASLFIVAIVIISLLFLLADNWNVLFNTQSLKEMEKQHFGGILINNTTKTIEITDNNAIRKITAGSKSRDQGIFDVDSVIINKPTKFEGEIYTHGVVKFCDFSSITVITKGKINELKPSFSYNLCHLFEEVGWKSRVGDGYVKM